MVYTRAQAQARELYGRTRALTDKLRQLYPEKELQLLPTRKSRKKGKKRRE